MICHIKMLKRVLIWLGLALIASYIDVKYTEIISVALLLQMAMILTEIKLNSVNRCAIIATRIYGLCIVRYKSIITFLSSGVFFTKFPEVRK